MIGLYHKEYIPGFITSRVNDTDELLYQIIRFGKNSTSANDQPHIHYNSIAIANFINQTGMLRLNHIGSLKDLSKNLVKIAI